MTCTTCWSPTRGADDGIAVGESKDEVLVAPSGQEHPGPRMSKELARASLENAPFPGKKALDLGRECRVVPPQKAAHEIKDH